MFHVKHLFDSAPEDPARPLLAILAALMLLAARGAAQPVPDLIAALQGGDETKRLAAREQLVLIGPEAVEPLLRVGFGDPARSLDDDGGTLITPGVMFYFLGKNKFGVNVDYYIPDTGDSEYVFRSGFFLYY